MKIHGSVPWNIVGIISVLLALALACGSSSPDPADDQASDQPSEKMDAPDKPADKNGAAKPTAEPKSVDEPAMAMKPEGTINVGLKEMGPFIVHPSTIGNPQIFVFGTPPIGEGLLQLDLDRNVKGLLAESWSISDDFLTWTFKMNQGVQFHKGYGEMTSEDVEWTMRQYATSKHGRAGLLADFFADRPGSERPDDYTLVVNTGEPIADAVAFRSLVSPGGGATFITSKKQTEELGVAEASTQLAGTGPWEIVDHKTGEFWKMEAVEDHWRQTPAFAELIFRELPEESSRIAGFQTGKLDTFLMSFDSIPLVEKVEGARLMSVPNAVNYRLRIYGNWYPIEGVEPRPGYNPELPWVSASDDVNSEEWDRARKVRLALVMAIDREALMETMLAGHGHTNNPLASFLGFVDLLEGRNWEYNQVRAKELLAEAGYAEGFSMTLTPAIRGASAEVEACEAVAQMLDEIGIDVKFQRVPYGTLRPQIVGRTYQGATCHGGSPYLTPAYGFGSLLTTNNFTVGVEHPYLEKKGQEAIAEVNTAKRRVLEAEVGAFLFDNVLSNINIYTMDAVWPVGPRLEPWTQHVNSNDLRQMNGYEYIQHRKY